MPRPRPFGSSGGIGTGRVPVAKPLAVLAVCVACAWLATLLVAGPSSAFTVAAAGDIGCPPGMVPDPPDPADAGSSPVELGRCQAQAVASMIAEASPRFTIATGDIVHGPDATVALYKRDFGRPWKALGDRVMPTIGNHDSSLGSGGRNFSAYFRYWNGRGAPASRIGSRRRPWASYDIGTWHFVNLNSNCRIVDCTIVGRQLKWLVQDLRRNHRNPETRCLVAYMHHPRFSTGIPLGRTGDDMLVSNLWEVLYRYRADLVLTGHQHYYERYRPLNPSGKPDRTGITQLITGTGGAVARRPEGEDNRTAVHAEHSVRALGATFLDLGENGHRTFFRTAAGDDRDVAEDETSCHAKNAGKPKRVRRTTRYLRRKTRLRKLDRRKSRLLRKLKRLRKMESRARRRATRRGNARPTRPASAKRRQKVHATLVTTRKKYRRLRHKPLYPAL